MHTVWRCAVTGKDFLFGLVGIEEEQMVQITDPIGQRADGEIFSGKGHQVPHHPFSCTTKHTYSVWRIVGKGMHFCSARTHVWLHATAFWLILYLLTIYCASYLLCSGFLRPMQWWCLRFQSRWSAGGMCRLVWTSTCPELAACSENPELLCRWTYKISPNVLLLLMEVRNQSFFTHRSSETSGVFSLAQWLHQTTARMWSSCPANSPVNTRTPKTGYCIAFSSCSEKKNLK